jgi:hypothetical protein
VSKMSPAEFPMKREAAPFAATPVATTIMGCESRGTRP